MGMAGGDLRRSVGSCRVYCSVPGLLQTVQRAELWGVILALHSAGLVHMGVDNLNVVREVDKLLDSEFASRPFELVKGGDLILRFNRMLDARGRDTVRITKVKGHADEDMVRTREEDRIGNDAADEAADYGRRRVEIPVIDARRNLAGVCGRWYPVVLDLHRFFIAISRAAVNFDRGGGDAPDPMVWSAGARPKRRRPLQEARGMTLLPGHGGTFWWCLASCAWVCCHC